MLGVFQDLISISDDILLMIEFCMGKVNNKTDTIQLQVSIIKNDEQNIEEIYKIMFKFNKECATIINCKRS